MVNLAVRFEHSIFREDSCDFLDDIEVDVQGFDENGQPALVGRLAIVKILWSELQYHGWSVYEALDDRSEALADVYRHFVDAAGNMRMDLDIEEPFGPVLYIERMLLHPDVVNSRQGILEAVAQMFGMETMTIVWRGIGGASDAELGDLGFRAVPNSSFLFKQSMLRCKFSDENPEGAAEDVLADDEHEEWVLANWE